jgi:hypothetical protein
MLRAKKQAKQAAHSGPLISISLFEDQPFNNSRL